MTFRNPDTDQEFAIQVHDKYPTMGEVYVEERYFVQVSTEFFVDLMDALGFDPVVPETPTKKTLDLL